MDSNIAEAASLLTAAKDNVLGLLKDNGHLLVTVEHGLNRIINQLNFLVGRQQEVIEDARTQFAPITHFMGEELNRPVEIKTEELSPKEAQRKIFLEKVDRLQNSIGELDNEAILDAYTQVNDTNVIRGVAKRAGLENYAKGEINHQFLDDIRLGLKAQSDKTDLKLKTENEIDNQ